MEQRAEKQETTEDRGQSLIAKGRRSRPQSQFLRTILVPIDLSPCSIPSLRYAGVFASNAGARLIVVHVREYNITGSWAVDLARTLVSATRNVESEFAALVGKEIPAKVPVTKLLLTGAPAHTIARVAFENRVDLIILTSHCRKGLEHARFGSVTEHLIQVAPCPVLVLPMRTVLQERHENKRGPK